MPECSNLPMLPCVPLVVALLLPCPALAQSADVVDESDKITTPWSGSSGELGFAATRGNSSTESFNGRLNLYYAHADWVHDMDLFGLRSSARYSETDAAGQVHEVRQTTANRYSIALNSAWQLGEHRKLRGGIRHEHDTFASFDSLYIVGVSYVTRLVDGERLRLGTQFGPGGRRAREAATGTYQNELIARGLFELKWQLTGNTELVNTLLVESGSSNTFAQSDFGILVAMNRSLALKAGWQARYNSDVDQGRRKMDTLATMNVVYRFK